MCLRRSYCLHPSWAGPQGPPNPYLREKAHKQLQSPVTARGTSVHPASWQWVLHEARPVGGASASLPLAMAGSSSGHTREQRPLGTTARGRRCVGYCGPRSLGHSRRPRCPDQTHSTCSLGHFAGGVLSASGLLSPSPTMPHLRVCVVLPASFRRLPAWPSSFPLGTLGTRRAVGAGGSVSCLLPAGRQPGDPHGPGFQPYALTS